MEQNKVNYPTFASRYGVPQGQPSLEQAAPDSMDQSLQYPEQMQPELPLQNPWQALSKQPEAPAATPNLDLKSLFATL